MVKAGARAPARIAYSDQGSKKHECHIIFSPHQSDHNFVDVSSTGLTVCFIFVGAHKQFYAADFAPQSNVHAHVPGYLCTAVPQTTQVASQCSHILNLSHLRTLDTLDTTFALGSCSDSANSLPSSPIHQFFQQTYWTNCRTQTRTQSPQCSRS